MQGAGKVHHESEEEKDLGVVIDGKLDFEKHINININKACGIMAIVYTRPATCDIPVECMTNYFKYS